MALSERFWSKVNKNGPTVREELGPCWLWTGSTKNGRYGNLWVNEHGKTELTHRIAWFLETGNWPNPNALHKCDNTLCVRFAHLFEGTPKDNAEDRENKDRNNHTSKLTEAQVHAIRVSIAKGENFSTLAKVYKVSQSCIAAIATHRTWAWLI
jgi:uncharacterized protein YeaC (DUF1315 family)